MRRRYIIATLSIMAGLLVAEWLLSDYFRLPTKASAVILIGVFLIGVLGSLLTAYGEKISQLIPGSAGIEQVLAYTWKRARTVTVFIIGATVVLIGIALIVLPGPAIVVIPLGLAILATEFVWARKILNQFKKTAKKLTEPLGFGKKTALPVADFSGDAEHRG